MASILPEGVPGVVVEEEEALLFSATVSVSPFVVGGAAKGRSLGGSIIFLSAASSPSARLSVVGAAEAEAIATMLPEDEDIGTLFSSSKGDVMENMPENPGFGSESCFDSGICCSFVKSGDCG